MKNFVISLWKGCITDFLVVNNDVPGIMTIFLNKILINTYYTVHGINFVFLRILYSMFALL